MYSIEIKTKTKNTLTPLEDWITSDIVCDMLDISPRTLLYIKERGQLGCSKIGNRCYYRRSDIESLLDKNFKIKEENYGI